MTNLVRVALEPIALVFLREREQGREKSLGVRTFMHARTFKHFQFKLETLLNSKREKHHREHTKKHPLKTTHLFAHVQLELLHGRVVELQTAHELVRLERHDDDDVSLFCAHKNAQRKWNFSTDTNEP